MFLALIAGWTAFFAWTNRVEALAGAQPAQWIDWIGEWGIPVLLVLATWVLALRNSSREAGRFGQTAVLLASEAERLETRLLTVNRELSLAREFLEGETRALDTLGRTAGERLSAHADHLQSLVHYNAQQLDTIAQVSANARDNMERLRGDLPVIANAAKDVANQIGNAGRSASEHLDDLAGGFARLAEADTSGAERIAALRERIEAGLTDFEERMRQVGDIAEGRFDALGRRSEELRDELGDHETQAMAALAERISALREEALKTARDVREGEEAAAAAWRRQTEAMRDRLTQVVLEIARIDDRALTASQQKVAALVAEAEEVDRKIAGRDAVFANRVSERQRMLEETEEIALAGLNERLELIDADFTRHRDAQRAHLDAMADGGAAFAERIAELGERIEDIVRRTRGAEDSIHGSADRLEEALAGSEKSLGSVEGSLAGLTDGAVRLLELIRASAKHSHDDLPAAIAEFEKRLGESEARIAALRTQLGQALDSGARLDETVSEAGSRALASSSEIDALAERIRTGADEHAKGLNDLLARLVDIETKGAAVGERLRGDLSDALGELDSRAASALDVVEGGLADRVRALAGDIAERSGAAIDEALRERLTETLANLEREAGRAAGASRDAAAQLRDQLAKVDELTRNLESRVAHARSSAEEQANNDFSRRVALISESLNSNAIDIGKALSTEVTDTAWTSYLRGDRGIFTRRAVRLLDTTELREIAELYDADPDFREHVSRYIHDFEAMLRTLLSTRDGNVLGVTVLSSDMGKLYVALAQAIERLRD